MTKLTVVGVECDCGHRFRVMTYDSIMTLMDPNLIKDLLEGKLHIFQCESCGNTIKLVKDMLINGPRGMRWISTGEPMEALKSTLRDLGAVNEQGEVRDPEAQQEIFDSRPDVQRGRQRLKLFLEKKAGEVMLTPVTATPEDTLETALKKIKRLWRKPYMMDEIMIVDQENKLLGLLGRREIERYIAGTKAKQEKTAIREVIGEIWGGQKEKKTKRNKYYETTVETALEVINEDLRTTSIDIIIVVNEERKCLGIIPLRTLIQEAIEGE